MWDYFCLFLCAGDVAKFVAWDCINQIAIIDLHLSEGYVAHSDWVTIYFKMF